MKRFSIMLKLTITVCFSLVLIEIIMGVLSVSGRYTSELNLLQSNISNSLNDYTRFFNQFGIPDQAFFEEMTGNNWLIDDIHLVNSNSQRISGNPDQQHILSFSEVLPYQTKEFVEIEINGQPFIIVNRRFELNQESFAIIVVKSLKDIVESSRAFGWRILWITLLIIVSVVGSILAISKMTIISPIRRLVEIVKNIAEGEGDLTVRVDVKSQDEISELATWLNEFIQKLHNLIKIVVENVSLLSEELTKVSSITDSIYSATNQVAADSQNADKSTVESTTEIDAVSEITHQTEAKIQEIVNSIREISQTTTEISEQSFEAEKLTKNAINIGNQALEQVGRLSDSAKKITGISEIIINIVDKTDLLALNATIEAARAGEAGKGFAVVASEVKELAQQSNQAIGEIQKVIRENDSDIVSTRDAIQEFSRVTISLDEFISTVINGIKQQNAISKDISKQFDLILQGIQEINQSMAKGAAATSDASKKVRDVFQQNAEISKISSELAQKTEDLIGIKENIQKSVSVFKL